MSLHFSECITLTHFGRSDPRADRLGTDADIARSCDGKTLPLDTDILIYILDHSIHYHTLKNKEQQIKHACYTQAVNQVNGTPWTDPGCRSCPDIQACTHTLHDVDGTQACSAAHIDTLMSSQIHTTTWGKLEKTLCGTFCLQTGEASDVKKITWLSQIWHVPGSTSFLALEQQSTESMYQWIWY